MLAVETLGVAVLPWAAQPGERPAGTDAAEPCPHGPNGEPWGALSAHRCAGNTGGQSDSLCEAVEAQLSARECVGPPRPLGGYRACSSTTAGSRKSPPGCGFGPPTKPGGRGRELRQAGAQADTRAAGRPQTASPSAADTAPRCPTFRGRMRPRLLSPLPGGGGSLAPPTARAAHPWRDLDAATSPYARASTSAPSLRVPCRPAPLTNPAPRPP